jgi:hypothetical protein
VNGCDTHRIFDKSRKIFELNPALEVARALRSRSFFRAIASAIPHDFLQISAQVLDIVYEMDF